MALECAVYGLLISEDDVSLTFETWSMTDKQQEEDLNDTSCFTIVRAAITRLVHLTESGPADRNASLMFAGGRESTDEHEGPSAGAEPSVQPAHGDLRGGRIQ
jgi:hypothetical protein